MDPAFRIIRSRFPPIGLFEDIADPDDWPLLIMSAEMKTNPRLVEFNRQSRSGSNRRGGSAGPGATYPDGAVHACQPATARAASPTAASECSTSATASRWRCSRPSTITPRFMAKNQPRRPAGHPQFRELLLDVTADLNDLRGEGEVPFTDLDAGRLSCSQTLGNRRSCIRFGRNRLSERPMSGGRMRGLFFPDLCDQSTSGPASRLSLGRFARGFLARCRHRVSVFRICSKTDGLLRNLLPYLDTRPSGALLPPLR